MVITSFLYRNAIYYARKGSGRSKDHNKSDLEIYKGTRKDVWQVDQMVDLPLKLLLVCITAGQGLFRSI